ncbi:MAG: ABC transporter substrate-binding protein [Pseudomonadota bacterium]
MLINRIIKYTLLILLLISINAYAYKVMDAFSQEVEFQNPPNRLISMAPNITEIIFELGLGSKLVGITDFCNFPEATKKIDKIGGFSNPSLEKIVSLKPDLVFLTVDGNSKSLASKLSENNIKIFVINTSSFSDISLSIKMIANALACSEKGKLLSDTMQSESLIFKAAMLGRQKPSVLFLTSVDPIISVGPKTFLDEIITLAGGENVCNKLNNRYPKLSFEAVVKFEPDLIIYPTMGNEDAAIKRFIEKLNSVLKKEVLMLSNIDPDLIYRPCPRIIQGLKIINKQIRNLQLNKL